MYGRRPCVSVSPYPTSPRAGRVASWPDALSRALSRSSACSASACIWARKSPHSSWSLSAARSARSGLSSPQCGARSSTFSFAVTLQVAIDRLDGATRPDVGLRARMDRWELRNAAGGTENCRSWKIRLPPLRTFGEPVEEPAGHETLDEGPSVPPGTPTIFSRGAAFRVVPSWLAKEHRRGRSRGRRQVAIHPSEVGMPPSMRLASAGLGL